MQTIIDRLKEKRTGDALLIVLTVFLFAWHYVDLVKVPSREVLENYFPMLWAGLAVIYMKRSFAFTQKGTWLLILGMGLIYGRSLFAMRQHDELVQLALTNGVWAFGVCYHAAFGFDKKNTMRLLRILAAVWTIPQVLMSLAGLYCVMFDCQIINFDQSKYIGLEGGRLSLWSITTITASSTAVSIIVAMVGMALTRNNFGRFCYAVSLIVLACALSLTGTRAAYLSLGIGLAIYLGSALYHWFVRQKKGQKKIAVVAVVMCMVLVAVLVCAAMISFTGAYNGMKDALKAQQEVVTSSADVATRGFEIREGMFSGREPVWRGTLEFLKNNPKYLLGGTSIGEHTMMLINEYSGTALSHVHCLYLQVLVELGLPGIIIMGVFLWLFARAAWKLLSDPQRPAWARMLPLLPVIVLTAEAVECLTPLRYNHPALYWMMLMIGLTVRVAEDESFE